MEYLASVGDRVGVTDTRDSLRSRLEAGYSAIRDHEAALSTLFLTEAEKMTGLIVHGVTDDVDQRTPTFSITVPGLTAPQLAQHLVSRGVAAGAGHFYALEFPDRMGLTDNGGFTRLGFFHYNTLEEVARVMQILKDIIREVA